MKFFKRIFSNQETLEEWAKRLKKEQLHLLEMRKTYPNSRKYIEHMTVRNEETLDKLNELLSLANPN